MCTLTVVPTSARRVRVAFNRDESPDRPAGLPPGHRRIGDRVAVMPTDPVSGGTWLAVNDAGLVLALLNVTPPEGKGAPGRRSRGEVIPALAGSESPAAALELAGRVLDYDDFAPFRLVLIGCGVVVSVRWDRRSPAVEARLLGGVPVLFTSSGLGDEMVVGVRRSLFEELFASPPNTWEAVQDEFHRHRWPGREHLSVNMRRATARTVSYSALDLGPVSARYTFQAAAPDQPADRVSVDLRFRPVGG